MSKPNYFGVGPRIARVLLPWLAASVIFTLIFPSVFRFPDEFQSMMFIVGLVWLIPGIVFYVISGKLMTQAVKTGQLVTSGPYRFSRNPLYAMVILNIIPGVALMMNSWLVLTTTLAGYLAFRGCIQGETEEMTARFGATYQEYCRRTSEFFPWLPKK